MSGHHNALSAQRPSQHNEALCVCSLMLMISLLVILLYRSVTPQTERKPHVMAAASASHLCCFPAGLVQWQLLPANKVFHPTPVCLTLQPRCCCSAHLPPVAGAGADLSLSQHAIHLQVKTAAPVCDSVSILPCSDTRNNLMMLCHVHHCDCGGFTAMSE